MPGSFFNIVLGLCPPSNYKRCMHEKVKVSRCHQSGSIAFVVALIALCSPAAATQAQAEQPPRTGIFTTQYTERSPLSAKEQLAKDAYWPIDQMPDYDIAKHDFQLVVPDGYDGSQAYGLLVFIHPNNEIALDRFYGRQIKDVLAKHNLIWVSYSGAGNPVLPNIRMGLALDAVHNVKKQYKVDDRRVYISGLSGGGRMTCLAGIYYPQVFKGAVPIVGTLYFREVKVPTDPKLLALMPEGRIPKDGVWRQGLVKPKQARLREMKKSQRWVFLAGEKDFNMPQMRAHFEQGFERDKFEQAHYLEVPGMPHTYPNAKWFEKAVVLLDKPLNDPPGTGKAPADERAQRQASKRLAVALNVLKRDEARGKKLLRLLVDSMPNTDAAKSAWEKLQELEGQAAEPEPQGEPN